MGPCSIKCPSRIQMKWLTKPLSDKSPLETHLWNKVQIKDVSALPNPDGMEIATIKLGGRHGSKKALN